MTVIIAARLVILVQGFSSKVEWTAKMNHVSIKVTALKFVKPLSLLKEESLVSFGKLDKPL